MMIIKYPAQDLMSFRMLCSSMDQSKNLAMDLARDWHITLMGKLQIM